MLINRKKVCIVATVPYALLMFMKPHIIKLSESYDITLIANGTAQDVILILNNHVRFISVNVARKISLKQDLMALLQLYKIFRKERFDIVHSLMPKTALLAMIAAFFSRVPHRIHTFTGQVWANKTGISRWGLKALDKVVVNCATNLLTDSFSQQHFLIEQGIVKKEKIFVLEKGSVCGVDIERFKPDLAMRHQIRSSLGIPDNEIVFLFLGRLNKDKGILDLAQAFSKIAVDFSGVHLLMVGPDEENMEEVLRMILGECLTKFHYVGFTDKPEYYMACADVFCLPSYREGFGSVIIEAAACKLPTIGSCIYGITDAVEDGKTGLLFPVGSVPELIITLSKFIDNPSLRQTMGESARVRALNLFSSEKVTAAMLSFYDELN